MSIFSRIRGSFARLDLFGLRGAEPRYHKGMRVLWLDNVIASISGAFLLTYVSLYALALGASNSQIGTLSSAASLMGMIAPIPGAQLARSWGSRRRVVVVEISVLGVRGIEADRQAERFFVLAVFSDECNGFVAHDIG